MNCAFLPSSGKAPGAAGCCSGDDCFFRMFCFDRDDMDDCDSNCQSDKMILKWQAALETLSPMRA